MEVSGHYRARLEENHTNLVLDQDLAFLFSLCSFYINGLAYGFTQHLRYLSDGWPGTNCEIQFSRTTRNPKSFFLTSYEISVPSSLQASNQNKKTLLHSNICVTRLTKPKNLLIPVALPIYQRAFI